MVVGRRSRWRRVVVVGGGGWWHIKTINNVYKVERGQNINNKRVPWAAGGSKKSGSSNQTLNINVEVEIKNAQSCVSIGLLGLWEN